MCGQKEANTFLSDSLRSLGASKTYVLVEPDSEESIFSMHRLRLYT